MSDVIVFAETTKAYGCFSNFYNLIKQIYAFGMYWKTTEHLYQAMKFLFFDQSELTLSFAREICQAGTAFQAKYLASLWTFEKFSWQTRLHGIVNEYVQKGIIFRKKEWDAVKIDVMYVVLQAKFYSSNYCWNLLQETKERRIEEHSRNDAFWGNGGKIGGGANHLGKTLMKLRSSQRENNFFDFEKKIQEIKKP